MSNEAFSDNYSLLKRSTNVSFFFLLDNLSTPDDYQTLKRLMANDGSAATAN